MTGKIKAFFTGTRTRAVLTGVAAFAVVSSLDFYVRNEISVDFFYFFPIFVLTWWAGWRWGTAAALVGMVDWLFDENFFAAAFPWSINILIWNALLQNSNRQ